MTTAGLPAAIPSRSTIVQSASTIITQLYVFQKSANFDYEIILPCCHSCSFFYLTWWIFFSLESLICSGNWDAVISIFCCFCCCFCNMTQSQKMVFLKWGEPLLQTAVDVNTCSVCRLIGGPEAKMSWNDKPLFSGPYIYFSSLFLFLTWSWLASSPRTHNIFAIVSSLVDANTDGFGLILLRRTAAYWRRQE